MRVTVQINDLTWRPLTDAEADTRFVVEVRSNPRFGKMFYNPSISAEGHKKFITSPAREDEINWLIEREGTPLGLASIYHLDRANRKAECGRTVMLEPKIFNQNYVVSAFIAYDIMKLNRLWIETLATNTTVARGIERLGMVREGVMQWHIVRDGKPLDVILFGATSQHWEEQRADRTARWGTPKLMSFDGWRFEGGSDVAGV